MWAGVSENGQRCGQRSTFIVCDASRAASAPGSNCGAPGGDGDTNANKGMQSAGSTGAWTPGKGEASMGCQFHTGHTHSQAAVTLGMSVGEQPQETCMTQRTF